MKCYPLLFCMMIIQNIAVAQLERRLDSTLQEYVKTGQPGIALYIEHNDKVLYKKAFGVGQTNGHLLRASTNFRMASVSKQFTAMSILLLEKDGKISFDDKISKFFPELPKSTSEKILVRHLLTHSSGLVDYESVMDENTTSQILDADVLSLLSTQHTTYFSPGTKFRYSNSGYALLALITERISGLPFPQFVSEHIFKPLKMKNSLVYQASVNIPHRAFGYARNKNGELFANDQSSTSAVKGDGGVYTSLNDYSKWTEALWTNKLVQLESVQTRLNFPIKGVTGSFYGPGWFYFDREQPSLFHSGSTCGFSTFSINIPGKKTSIVYFSNIANNSGPWKRILEILAAEGIANPKEADQLHELTR